jgi:hypothetical protein
MVRRIQMLFQIGLIHQKLTMLSNIVATETSFVHENLASMLQMSPVLRESPEDLLCEPFKASSPSACRHF